MTDGTRPTSASLVHAAADALQSRRDEVNRLNVFPVPDGDTGTNMALTMDAVLAEIDASPADSGLSEVCRAVTHGSLMGARGNSGVILSQVLRGLCEVLGQATTVDGAVVRDALDRAVTVSFQAVRKPVEGTMLTVLKDAAAAAVPAVDAGLDIPGVLAAVVDEAYASVRRTPELLPVLKENGVVDAGGYGLAILMDGFASLLAGTGIRSFDVTLPAVPPESGPTGPSNDWDDEEYLYCTEFLLFGDDIDKTALTDFVASVGGSELVVGGEGSYKVHVHTDDPAVVLQHATSLGEVAEVHIHNMRRQTVARAEGIRADRAASFDKPLGFVAVAAGDGLARILTSLGVDVVVSGGQTMNPSTAELLTAIDAVPARAVIVLPNNRNIIMAAQQTVGLASKPVGVVQTTSVPQSFAAMIAADRDASLEENIATMTAAAANVRSGEVTWAIKDSKGKVGAIRAGQVIGISDHEIEAVGSDVADVAADLLDVIAEGGEILTLIAGLDLSDEDLAALAARLAAAHPEMEIETHRGDQPLYPLMMSVE